MTEAQSISGVSAGGRTIPRVRRDRMWRAFLVLIGLALFSATAAGGPGHNVVLPGTAPYLTVFLLDGARQDVVFRELNAGRLPNIAALGQQGAIVEKGISSFPSMTGYAYYPVVTGLDSTRSGVLGLRWFDRSRDIGNLRSYVGTTNDMMSVDFAPSPKLMYERFDDQHSFTLNTYANRGVKTNAKAGFAYARAKYHRRYWLLRTLGKIPVIGKVIAPDWEEAEDIGVAKAIDDLERRPKIQWITLASMDAHQHISGTDARYAEIIRYADKLIGEYREASRKLGQEKDRIYLITTDHGATDADKNLDVREVLDTCCGLVAERDGSTHVINNKLDQPLSEWFDKDAAVVINGDMLNYLYFRDPGQTGAEAWRQPVGLDRLRDYRGHDVVDALRKEAALRFVMGWSEKEQAAKVFTADGEGTIREGSGGLSYEFEGTDPFGYQDDPHVMPLFDGRAHPPRAWLEATYDTKFPDAVYRVHRLMTAPGAPDLVVTAAAGWDLGKDYEVLVGNYKGGHGGLNDEQMTTWYVLAGPGVRRGARLKTARVEDIGITLFPLMNIKPEPEANGRILNELLSQPVRPHRSKDTR